MKVGEVIKILSEVNDDVEVRITDDEGYYELANVEYDPIRDQAIIELGKEDNDIG